MSLRKELPIGSVKRGEPLCRHTTFEIGGPADFWAEPEDPSQLKELLLFAGENAIPYFVLGAGSNILASDEGFHGLAIRLGNPSFSFLDFDGVRPVRNGISNGAYLSAGGGAALKKLCVESARNGMSGLEHLFGVPGTLGGALAGNAGSKNSVKGPSASPRGEQETRDRGIGEVVEEVEVMDSDGGIKVFKREELKFGYRSSNISNFLILKAKLKLREEDPPAIEERMREVISHKKKTQELSLPSAGCIFKNPGKEAGPKQKGFSAGELIEKSGLKGHRIGGAAVSRKHANFIVNLGKATCRDVLALIVMIKEKVHKDHGILLEEEIKILGGS